MKVLVTGSTGFVGSNLVNALIKKGFSVRSLVRLSSSHENLKNMGVDIIIGDITDKKLVREAVEGVDIVFHIAALFRQAGFRDSIYWDINVGGTENVLDVSLEKGIKRFIHCSTVGVLSHITNPPADETYPYNPGDIYQETKAEGEKLALKYFREKRLPGLVIRPAMIYGPGDTRLLKLFKMIARKRFIMLGDGKTLAHFIYIDDLIRAFLLSAENSKAVGNVYIIAGEGPFTLNDLVRLIAESLNIKPPRLHFPVGPFLALGLIFERIFIPLGIEPPIYRRRVDFFTKDRSFNTTKAQKELGFYPEVSMKTGIKRTIAWYRKNNYL